MAQPLVSIGMPVRDSEDTIRCSIISILNQSYLNWELIIIDDGSSDNSMDIVHGFSDARIHCFVDGIKKGQSYRRNEALNQSKGKYYAILDSDDIAYPDRIEQQVQFLEHNPEVDLIGTSVMVFNGDGMLIGKRQGPQSHDLICAKPTSGFPIVQSTFLGKVEWFKKYKYHHRAVRSEDQDLLLRSYSESTFANLPEILVGYREKEIDLKKILTERYQYTAAAMDFFLDNRKLLTALRVILEQTMKGLIDTFAVKTHLNYRILRHRAQKVNSMELKEWIRVWSMVNNKL